MSESSTQDASALFADAFGASRLRTSTVSRATNQPNQDFDTWGRRDLSDLPIAYLFLDGQYHAARQGTDAREGVLSAYALLEDGRPVLLHLDVGSHESLEAWLSFLQELVARGLRDPLLVVDGAPVQVKALKRVWPRAYRHLCLAYKMRTMVHCGSEMLQAMVTATSSAGCLAKREPLTLFSRRAPRDRAVYNSVDTSTYGAAAVAAANWLTSVAMIEADHTRWPVIPGSDSRPDHSLYYGTAGIIHLSSTFSLHWPDRYLTAARRGAAAIADDATPVEDVLLWHLRWNRAAVDTSLYLGGCGIAVAFHHLFEATHDEQYSHMPFARLVRRYARAPLLVPWNGHNDVVSGAAGIGLACYECPMRLEKAGGLTRCRRRPSVRSGCSRTWRLLVAEQNWRRAELASVSEFFARRRRYRVLSRQVVREHERRAFSRSGPRRRDLAPISPRSRDRCLVPSCAAGARHVLCGLVPRTCRDSPVLLPAVPCHARRRMAKRCDAGRREYQARRNIHQRPDRIVEPGHVLRRCWRR